MESLSRTTSGDAVIYNRAPPCPCSTDYGMGLEIEDKLGSYIELDVEDR